MTHLAAQRPSPSDDTTLLVSLLERPIGREVSHLRPDGADWVLTSDLDLVERGGPLKVSAMLRLRPDLSPSQFTVTGRSYRFVNADARVTFGGGGARVEYLGETTTVPLPRPYFAASGYAPLAARALLVRYWQRHNRPAVIDVVPGVPTRDVRITRRGADTITVGAREITLQRYTVDGIVWGRETVWLDAADRIAAIVSRIHILPLEAVREDLAGAQPMLQEIAVRDAMQDLARMTGEVAPSRDKAIALVGGTVIDATGRPPIEDATVVVSGGRIVAVGPRATTAVPAGSRTVDVGGKTIVPGLWDMHAHASQIEWAPAYLAAGVTTIRDMGGERAFLLGLRDTIASGRGPGPRVLLAGLVDGESPGAFGRVTAGTPEAGREIVDRYHADRFDQMKLYSLLQPDVVSAIVSRAHEVGMTVTGHVPTSLGSRGAIEAGMDHIAHMPVSGDPGSAPARELIALLASRHVVVDPTLPWGELLGRAPDTPVEQIEPGLALGPPALVMNYRSVRNTGDAAAARSRVERQLAMIKALHAAGVPIVAGTDGAVPGHSLLRALELSVQAGLSPLEAIQTATIVAARAMRLDADAGTIEAGKRADLLVLDANPLDDISNIRRARWVIANGRLFDPAPLWRAAGFRAASSSPRRPATAPAPSAPMPSVIPLPAKMTPGRGVFTIHATTPIVVDAALRAQGRQLAAMLAPATGFDLTVRAGASPATPHIALRRQASLASSLGAEGYRLEATPRAIVIRAATPAGVFYGLQTLRQLLPPAIFRSARAAGVPWQVPATSIEDAPRFSWRGMHLDVARHFQPKEFVKKYLDLLALHKMNRFHWHLTDDQGWRIEIARYPKLTEVAAYRRETLIGRGAGGATAEFDGTPHGGFYTKDDIREIVAYAAERFITIVPEIEMPGHSQAVVAAYPELGSADELVDTRTTWGVSPYLLNVEPATIAFMQNVLAEVIELFPGPWVHVGGDEAVKTQWQADPRIQARRAELGLKDDHALQSWFIQQMDTFLTSKKRRLIGWDEILEGGLAENATVMAWRDVEHAMNAARAGHDAVLTPTSHTYFDYYQSRDTAREPLAIGGFLPLDRVYTWEPMPADLEPRFQAHILGVQGQIWTEYMPGPKAVEYMAFPRLTALAEVAWTPAGRRGLDDFLARLATHLERLRILDVKFRPLD